MIISPSQFFEAFESVVTSRTSDILLTWDQKQKAYTKLMRQELLATVANALQLSYYPSDYYTLDGIMYLTRDSVNFRSQYTYVHSISVALEHENNPACSMEEINKLQLFNTPLKVLVTYPCSSGPNAADQLLSRYADAIRSADIFEDFSTLRRQLVIFGSKLSGKIHWQGFEYSEGALLPLNDFPADGASVI